MAATGPRWNREYATNYINLVVVLGGGIASLHPGNVHIRSDDRARIKLGNLAGCRRCNRCGIKEQKNKQSNLRGELRQVNIVKISAISLNDSAIVIESLCIAIQFLQ